ncbi:MAG: hypothetical protein K1V92_13150, partial [Bacteroides acidifaciens]
RPYTSVSKAIQRYGFFLKPANISRTFFQENFYHTKKRSEYQQLTMKTFFLNIFTSFGSFNKRTCNSGADISAN